MPEEVGLASYQSTARSAPEKVLAQLMEKSRLKAALCAVQADLDAAIPALSPSEMQELQGLMAVEVAAVDGDVENMRHQIAEELAQPIKAMRIQISRTSSSILAREVERRVARGSYPSAQALIAEALHYTFGDSRL